MTDALALATPAAKAPALHAMDARRPPQVRQAQATRRDPRSLDARSLAMHQRIAAKVRRQPTLLERARATIDRWEAQGASAASHPYREA